MALFVGRSRADSSVASCGSIACLAAVAATFALVACGDDVASGGAGGTSDTVTTGSASNGGSTTGTPASGSSGTSTGDTSSSGTSSSGTTSSGTSSGSTSGTTTTSSTTATTASQTSASITVGALMSCGDAGLMDCFSSYECAMDSRCEDQGVVDAPVPCCVPGMRGPGVAGDMCTGEADCYSSLCFEIDSGTSVCTDSCDDIGDCPAPFESCNFIAGSGSALKFCLP